jgi:hypothetical protein
MKPGRIIFVAFLMVLIGAVLPFLMVIRVFEATLWLSFFSYGMSVAGLFLGVFGAANYARDRHWRDN